MTFHLGNEGNDVARNRTVYNYRLIWLIEHFGLEKRKLTQMESLAFLEICVRIGEIMRKIVGGFFSV